MTLEISNTKVNRRYLPWAEPALRSFRKSLLLWFRNDHLKDSRPWREAWRIHKDPYFVWVSEIMLQQTVIKVVIPVYNKFIKEFPNLNSLASASEAEIKEAVRGLGYYRRFRMMHQCAQTLVTQHKGIWPKTKESLQTLPGIGAYTSAAIGSIAFGDPSAVVDGNVERVVCRLFDIRHPPKSVFKDLKNIAQDLLDPNAPGDYNEGIMELGQLVCTPTSPKCGQCPVALHCASFTNRSQHLAPAPNPKVTPVGVAMQVTIPVSDGFIGLIERSHESKFLKNSLGFPFEFELVKETQKSSKATKVGATRRGCLNSSSSLIGTIRHSITHHRIKAQVFVQKKTPHSLHQFKWVKIEEVEKKLISNLDRKAWHLFEAHGL